MHPVERLDRADPVADGLAGVRGLVGGGLLRGEGGALGGWVGGGGDRQAGVLEDGAHPGADVVKEGPGEAFDDAAGPVGVLQ